MNKEWAEDEIELLKTFIECGWYNKDISIELGRTIKSIQHKVSRIKISSNREYKFSNDKYIKLLKEKCPTMIALEKYVDSKYKILHKCLLCNKEYLCRPKDRLEGHGCKYCGQQKNKDKNGAGIPINEPGTTYLVYIPKFDLYKIGITAKTTQERMKDNKIQFSDYVLILERRFSKGIDAVNLERKWIDNMQEYLVNTGLLSTGNTETFRI